MSPASALFCNSPLFKTALEVQRWHLLLDPHPSLQDITAASVFHGIDVHIPFCLCVFEIICDLCVFVFLPSSIDFVLLSFTSFNCVCLLLQNRISPFIYSFLGQVPTLFFPWALTCCPFRGKTCQFMITLTCWHFLACLGKKCWWPKGSFQTWIPFVVAAYFAAGYLLTSVPVYVHTLYLPVVPHPFRPRSSEFSPAFEIVQMCI